MTIYVYGEMAHERPSKEEWIRRIDQRFLDLIEKAELIGGHTERLVKEAYNTGYLDGGNYEWWVTDLCKERLDRLNYRGRDGC